MKKTVEKSTVKKVVVRTGAPASIVVSVAGGVVTGVWSDDPGVQVRVYDFDNKVEELMDDHGLSSPGAAATTENEFADIVNGMTDLLRG